MTWSIERMDLERDLDGVLEVQASSFTNPTSREAFEWEARHSDVAQVLVAKTSAGQVIGYCSVWIVFEELHINNVAVRPAWRSRGIGRALLEAVCDEACRLGAQRATLEVRASNEAARRLYRSLGFEERGVRPGYYRQPVEDALILWREPLAVPTARP